MYINFELHTTAAHTEGYLWDTEKPRFVVCLVHGIAEYAGRYDRVAGVFADNNIAMVGMDLRGHGLSSGVRGHCAPRKDILDDIDKLILFAQQRYPGVPVVLYGHSMGGNIVLDYRIRGGQKDIPQKYIVSSPWLLLSRNISGALYAFTKTMAVIWPTFKLKSNIDPALLGNPKVISSCEKKNLVHNCITVLTGLDGYEIGKALSEGKLHCQSEAIQKKPLLLMHGSNDRVCSVEGSRRLAAMQQGNCTYVEWPGYYHEIHNGYGDVDGMEVINRMVEFIMDTPDSTD